MAFTVLHLTHAPDANMEKHRSIIDTGMYRLYTVVVRNQAEVLEICTDYVENKAVDSILLCPGFKKSDVDEIVEVTGGTVAVSVARGVGQSAKISLAARIREGYMSTR